MVKWNVSSITPIMQKYPELNDESCLVSVPQAQERRQR